ncbi:MAG: N-6 DNA methylase, partial [Chitinophagales bacterium]|nr:N-6 DNA methylase [Chitinophagales bacterium]MDW8427020.1 N-6 DNA methylase [Chitinophagales bacterium]
MMTSTAIRFEGGLLGPDTIEQIMIGELPGQRPSDFGLDTRGSINEEVAAAFADSRKLWEVFQNRLARLPDDDIGTSTTRDAWMVPFFGLFGIEPRYNPRAYEVDGLTFAISHRMGEQEDAPPVHIVGARQELGRLPPSGRPRLAPHSLVQEYLNRTEHVWGIVTNGITLRLLRNSTFIRRQAYIEFDLKAIIEEQLFNDFVLLYRLLHRTRFPRGTSDAHECLLEQYYRHSEEQGGRVRERLREGVEQCIRILANGFLAHPGNDELRSRIASQGNDRISPEDLYRQLLRLIYRFLFLLVSEDRGLLSTDPLYRDHYSIGRVRRLLENRSSFTDHDDIWCSLQALWKVLGDDKLAGFLSLPPLNGELFAEQALDTFTISNRQLLEGFWYLTWYQERANQPPRRINYFALDVEELGSVYESLLEFHPVITVTDTHRPAFDLISGSERKTTGSYYTPVELVAELVRSALEPVLMERLAQAKTAEEKQQAILSLRIIDPCCGSGHFLLAAARRLGKELARLRTREDEPPPEQLREATRDVISHCIYGVDLNPLAVELCRVALWLESHTPGKPLTFLDHHIRCGNALVGVLDLDLLIKGIPDDAFEALQGDDRTTARQLLKQNRDERQGQRSLFDWNASATLNRLCQNSHMVEEIGNDTPAHIRLKQQRFTQSRADVSWQRSYIAANLWTASFFQWLKPDQLALTTAALADCLTGRSVDPRVVARAEAIALEQHFLHWPLEFPEVFAKGGFDVVLCNPPWEIIELEEQEFFASRDPEIARAPNRAARQRLIGELPRRNPALWQEYQQALHDANATSKFLRASGRFPLTARG